MLILDTAAITFLFTDYIGQEVVIDTYRGETLFGELTAVAKDDLEVGFGNRRQWLHLDHPNEAKVKLLLKPLSNLTEEVRTKAERLPAKQFIPTFYKQQGFDMPAFIAPDHILNCKTMKELGLADYRSKQEIQSQFNTVTM